MLLENGDIWLARQPFDYVVITTNGTLRRDGALVMGRGIAKEASAKFKYLQQRLGFLIKQNGLRVELVSETDRLIAFPVKYEFFQRAETNLILKSTIQLLALLPKLELGRILMPRPGCGNGRLDWAEVEPMMQHYLVDDRFIIFNKESQQNVFRKG